MSTCLLVKADGRRQEVKWDQSKIAEHLGGSLTFVGALPILSVFIVCRAPPHSEGVSVNAMYSSHRHLFMEQPRGDLVFIASDDDGEEMDVDVEALTTTLGS